MKEKIKQKGFTLIELLISVGVFTVIMTIIVGLLIVTSDVVKKTRAIRNTMDNVNVVLESMAKNIRTGSVYHCNTNDGKPLGGIATSALGSTQDCAIGAVGHNWVAFRTQENKQVVYFYNVNGGTDGYVEKAEVDIGDSITDYKRITSPEVDISSLIFFVTGSSPTDFVQPIVTILISGEIKLPGKTNLDTEFKAQTSVTHTLNFDDI